MWRGQGHSAGVKAAVDATEPYDRKFGYWGAIESQFAAGGISLNVTKDTMKTLRSIITACVAIFALSPVAFGLPAGKDGAKLPTLTKKSQFEELKGGDKVVLVCKMCDTVKVIDVRDTKQAMALGKEGRAIHCEVCKKKYKVTWTAPGKSGGPLTTKLLIVDEKGKPCMFFAKLS
jgi:hypothetical protein